ncbi:MAG: DNA polymerase III subunit alpha, partial [Flavobacteriaceae bacterium]
MAAGAPPFIHLRSHSAYSLLEGAIPLGKLIGLATKNDMPALGLADRNNLFGALEFSEKAAGAGLQPLIGVTIPMASLRPAANQRPGERLPSIVLIAKDEAGYRNLLRLVSHAHLSGDGAGAPCLSYGTLETGAEGLIALSGGLDGPIDMALAQGDESGAADLADRLAGMFGDRFYIELQRHGLEVQKRVEPALLHLAYAKGLPVVATNQPYFAGPEDHEAHDALIAIAEGKAVADPDRRQLSPEHWFKPAEMMAKLFADLPEALDNTVEIARRSAFRPLSRAPILPRFLGDGEGDELVELRRQAEEGLAERLRMHGLAPGMDETRYKERLAFEIDVIGRMQYPGYFLIVSDFIKWAKSRGIPVGPGRGSGAGSLVAWALTITDLDPLRFNLLFERFLNPERVSMPDFDIDFCPTGRDDVIRYVQERYGRDRVAQIITFGTLQARAVVRDVARVLGVSYGQADQLSKMIPANPANPVTLAEAIDGEPRLKEARDSDPTIRRLLDTALKLEGLYRHASTHAAGIVIGDRDLTELVPLYKDPRSDMPASQFNMKWVEAAGLVKFDFLGLKTLTVIELTAKLLRERGIDIDIGALPLDDARTYAMLSRAETVGIFQLESGGMRNSILGMKPDRFEDIIALVALYRPGPMANIPVYNERKHGRAAPDYVHPLVEPILKETFGVIIYQEQVMQIAQELAGYSLGEADLLRRAMGKKIASEMAKMRPRFVSGAAEKGIGAGKANEIFDLLAKFEDYGFNKSHAAAYALVAYQTAWLKANHPVEFFAASMSVDMGNTAKLDEFRREARRIGVNVRAPSVNSSGVEFLVRDGEIHYSLAALRNVGRHTVERIVQARGDRPFRSLADFAARVGAQALNRRALESLAAAGAFDELTGSRAQAHAAAESILAVASRTEQDRISGQSDMFGGGDQTPSMPLPVVAEWHPADRLKAEFEAVGSFISGHPLDDYAVTLKRLRVETIADFNEAMEEGVSAARIAGIVVSKNERRTRTGGRVGIIGLSDPTGQVEAVAFSEMLSENRALFEPG